MHPRNPYRIPPDFSSLAQAYPPLQQFLIDTTSPQSATINFKNDSALRSLTQAIMFRDFGIHLQIPEDRLCPPVPNRMDYVLWIQDIMEASGTFRTEVADRAICGIDIGTGATAIYPFLLCKLEGDWEMVGTELDDRSYQCARRNVETNNLDGQIIIKQAEKNGAILFPLECEAATFDFTMCNPPFYSSSQEMANLSKEKAGAPNAVCTGSDIEMIYPDGGEIGFVARLVEESIKFQGRCRWYTSMLGKLSSVIAIVELFRKRKISNYAITEFVQGRTRRWAIGWSFSATRLPDSISRIILPKSHALASYMPLHTTLRQPLRLPPKKDKDAARCLRDVLKVIEGLRVTEHKGDHRCSSFRVEGYENTWSRSARRKRQRTKAAGEQTEAGTTDNQDPRKKSLPGLVCDVRLIQLRRLDNPAYEDSTFDLRIGAHPRNETNVEGEWIDFEMGEDVEGSWAEQSLQELDDSGYSLECQWIIGTDHRVFDSFAGHIGRKLIECIHAS